MTIVEARMAYEGADRLLRLTRAYEWPEADIAAQERAVAECKAEYEKVEKKWA